MSDVQQQQEALQEEFQSLLENPAILQLIEFGIEGVKAYIDIDISILIVTQLLLDGCLESSQCQKNGRVQLYLLIVAVACFWYFLLGNFILPTLKFFSPKRYYLWIGDKKWANRDSSSGRRSIFHPLCAIYVNFIVSDVCFTLYEYAVSVGYIGDEPTEELGWKFYMKVVAGVLNMYLVLKMICKDRAIAEEMYGKYKEAGLI
uniref:Uncharacterized protein n=1 Tax=Ditylum brightwellii TaxID=49249 RepID=A0A7S4STS8_9STRA